MLDYTQQKPLLHYDAAGSPYFGGGYKNISGAGTYLIENCPSYLHRVTVSTTAGTIAIYDSFFGAATKTLTLTNSANSKIATCSGNVTSTATVVSNTDTTITLSANTNIAIGQYIAGVNIAPGTIVTAIASNVISLSKPVLGTVTAASTPVFLEAVPGMFWSSGGAGLSSDNPFTIQRIVDIGLASSTTFLITFDRPILSANSAASVVFNNMVVGTINATANNTVSVEYGAHLINAMTIVTSAATNVTAVYSSQQNGG